MQQRSGETRAKIMKAALECFSRAGYDASGVAEICAEAGVSKGAFYHHFPSKQAVFIALMNDWLTSLDGQFDSIRTATGSVPAALRAMVLAARPIFGDVSGRLGIFLEFWTQASRDPLLREKIIEPFARYERYFAGLVRTGIAEGSLRPVDPDEAARTIIALAVGLLAQNIAGHKADWAATAQGGVEMFLSGLEIVPGPGPHAAPTALPRALD